MTSPTLAEARAELVADLRLAGFAVTENVDQTVNAPAVLVTASADEDFLSNADTFPSEEVLMRLDLYLVPALAQGVAFIDGMTAGLQKLLLSIDDRWAFHGASAPFRASNLGGQVACRVKVSTTARLVEL